MEFIVENIHMVLALIGAGIFAGLLAGLLGVGGGVVIVPVLFFLFQSVGVSPESAMGIATATSLATIIFTSLSSINSHRKKGNVDFGLIKTWTPFVILGVIAGSWLVTRVPGTWFTVLFGIVAIFAAFNMMFRTSKSAVFDALPGISGQASIAAIIGFFSSMVGIGGGTFSVPTLTAFNFQAHKAVGTSAAIGLLISLPGAITMLVAGVAPADAPVGTFGLVNLVAFGCIVPLTVLFAPVGANIASKLDAAKLKKVFALVLFVTGGRMLIQLFL